jgi:hypothetical protein
MAGLVPAIHVLVCSQDVDARHKLALGPAEGRTRVAGHDGGEADASQLESVLVFASYAALASVPNGLPA